MNRYSIFIGICILCSIGVFGLSERVDITQVTYDESVHTIILTKMDYQEALDVLEILSFSYQPYALYLIESNVSDFVVELGFQILSLSPQESESVQVLELQTDGWEIADMYDPFFQDSLFQAKVQTQESIIAIVDFSQDLSESSQEFLAQRELSQTDSFVVLFDLEKPYVYILLGIGVLLLFAVLIHFILHIKYQSYMHKKVKNQTVEKISKKHTQKKVPTNMPPPKNPQSDIETKILSYLREGKSHGFIVNALLDEGHSMDSVNEAFSQLAFSHPGETF